MSSPEVLQSLMGVIRDRQAADPTHSYVASLLHKGDDAILKKLGEEATETVIAAKNGDTASLVHEIADLWFHTMVLLVHKGLDLEAVTDELTRRFGVSGHAEKSARHT